MSVTKVKNVDGSFLLSKQLADKGFHTFTVAKTSGNVQVTSSNRVTLALGSGSVEWAQLNAINNAGFLPDFVEKMKIEKSDTKLLES